MGADAPSRTEFSPEQKGKSGEDEANGRSRNDYGSTMIWNDMFIAFTPKQTFDGAARTAHAGLHHDAIDRTLPDTPPADVSIKAGLLAHGSSHPLRLPGKTQWPDGESTRRSQLRGQPRLHGPHVRYRIPVLAPDPHTNRREPRTLDIVDEVKFASTAMIRLHQIDRG